MEWLGIIAASSVYGESDDEDIDFELSQEVIASPDKQQEPLQKVNRLSRFVPYREQLEQTRVELWRNLKDNLCTAIVEQGESLKEWIYAFHQYMNAYGFVFSKQEHLIMIEICWKALVEWENDFLLMSKLARVVSRLLSKPHLLSRKDLQLDWRSLYKLVDRIYDSNYRRGTVHFKHDLSSNFATLIKRSKVYFSAQSTGEMLTDWKQYMCIYSNKYAQYLELFASFLPLLLPPEEHRFGFKLWFDDFIQQYYQLPKNNYLNQCCIYLFSSLARNANGYIDWEPHLPAIFQRLQKDLNGSQQLAKWIVFMISPQCSCLQYVQQLFRSSCSNFKTVIFAILQMFVYRLRSERRGLKRWYDFTPQSHLLNDEIITKFASIMMTYCKYISFAKYDMKNIYNLSLICSEALSAKVIEEMALAEERIFEPDRTNVALQNFSFSLFSIVTNVKIGTQYRNNVILILGKLVKSINTSDHTLCCLYLFAIRTIVILGMPLENCSKLTGSDNNLSKNEILKDSHLLDKFPMDFLQLCFKIIECNNQELFYTSQSGLSLKTIIYDIFVNVLANVSEAQQKMIIERVISYATKSIIEDAQSCKFLQTMIVACLMFDTSHQTLGKLYGSICANIISSFNGENRFSKICKSEFIYNLRLLHACIDLDGKVLVKYRNDLVNLLKRIHSIDFENNFKYDYLITFILAALFYRLTNVYLNNDTYDPNFCKDLHNENVKTNWPYQVKLKDLSLDWHEPNVDEVNFARVLFREFIKPEMTSLEQWTQTANSTGQPKSNILLSPSIIEKSLTIIQSFLGCSQCLPSNGDDLYKKSQLYFTQKDVFAYDLFDGEDFRHSLIVLMRKVVDRLKGYHNSDNVTLHNQVLEILSSALFSYESGNSYPKAANSISQSLVHNDLSIPLLQYERIDNYHTKTSRLLKKWCNLKFTSTHSIAVDLLFELSICSNTEIRISAQSILLSIQNKFPKSFQLILPRLVSNLKLYKDNIKAFKGTLYILYGGSRMSVLLSQHWDWLMLVWPALVEINYAEKPKIANLVDRIVQLFETYYYTILIERKSVATQLSDLFGKATLNGFKIASSEDIQQIEKSIQQCNQTNRQLYDQLIQRLINTLKAENLHWRFYSLGFYMLHFLIRYDTTFPLEAIELFLGNLVHDSIVIRNTAVLGLKKILFLVKSKTGKQTQSVLIDSKQFASLTMDCFTDQSRYENCVFYDKVHIGFYPNMKYTTSLNKPIDGKLVDSYQFIANKFNDKNFLDKLLYLNSAEQSVNISMNFVKLWKHLFKIFNLFNSDLLFPRIELLLNKKKHHSDKVAVEIIAGLIKASSSLEYDQLQATNKFILSIFAAFLPKLDNESYKYWSYLFSLTFSKRDLRRNLWAFDHFFDENLFAPSAPYIKSSFMYFISYALNSNWKYPQLSEKVLQSLADNLAHPYMMVRESLAYLLSNVFLYKIGLNLPATCCSAKLSRSDFVGRIEQMLKTIFDSLFVTVSSSKDENLVDKMTTIQTNLLNDKTKEGQLLHNQLHTICLWVRNCLVSTHLTNVDELVRLFPYICLVYTNNKLLMGNSTQTLTSMSLQIYSKDHIDSILVNIAKVSQNWNWHSRRMSCQFINNILYSNLFTLRLNHKWIDYLLEITLTLLADEVLEVRLSARITLSSIITHRLIDLQRRAKMIEEFKAKCSKGEPIVTRHAAILGLCAFIQTFVRKLPHDFPNILVFLSKHATDRNPIQDTVTSVLRWFKKSSDAVWLDIKKQFTEEQLIELDNVLVSNFNYF